MSYVALWPSSNGISLASQIMTNTEVRQNRTSYMGPSLGEAKMKQPWVKHDHVCLEQCLNIAELSELAEGLKPSAIDTEASPLLLPASPSSPFSLHKGKVGALASLTPEKHSDQY